MTCLAKKPIVRDPHIFDRKEAARGSRAREVTCGIQKWNIKAEGFHPILVANARVDWLAMDDDDITKKHLWYNLDIRWVDLKDKLEVLAPTGLTRDDIWRHLFLTKQRKNPYEEGCCTGEDLEDVKRKWEAKKEYFLQYCGQKGWQPPSLH